MRSPGKWHCSFLRVWGPVAKHGAVEQLRLIGSIFGSNVQGEVRARLDNTKYWILLNVCCGAGLVCPCDDDDDDGFSITILFCTLVITIRATVLYCYIQYSEAFTGPTLGVSNQQHARPSLDSMQPYQTQNYNKTPQNPLGFSVHPRLRGRLVHNGGGRDRV